MKYVYISRTGKTEKLVQALGIEAVKINDGTETVEGEFILFTYTDGKGAVPAKVKKFLKNNSGIKGVVATGNMARHEDTFCFAGDKIAEEFDVPCYAKLDGTGTEEDHALLKEKLGL